MRHQPLSRLLVAVATALMMFLASGSAFAQYAEAKDSPGEGDIGKAKQHMAAGVAFMQDPDGARYEEAYPEFRKAYELSGSLNALQNLAICSMKLELDGEAIKYFARFVEKKGDDIDEADKTQVERDLAALKSSVAWIKISSDKGGVSMSDVRTPRRGAKVRNQYDVGIQERAIGVHPGEHVFTAVGPDGKELSWRITLKNGKTESHEFRYDPNAPVTADGFTMDDPKPDTPEEDEGDEDGGGGVNAGVWVALGITIAALGVWAGFMGKSAGDKAEYDDKILGKKELKVQQEAADDLETTNLLADVFLGVAGAGAIATIIIAAVTAGGDDDSEDEARSGDSNTAVNLKLSPSFDPRGGGALMLTGEF
jgi:hypothetical protein